MRVRGGVLLGVVVAASSCSRRSLDVVRDAGGGAVAQSPKDAGRDAAGSTDGASDRLAPADAASDSMRPGDGACAGQPDAGSPASCTGPTADGGGGAPGIVTVSLPSREIGPVTGSADTIAADGSGVYWLTHDNELWMLDETAGAVPRPLASDAGPSIICSGHGRLTVAGDQLFWVAAWSGPGNELNGHLHRTTKTGEDVVLVDNVTYSDPIDVVVDGNHVYWNKGISSGAPPPATFVRTLPRDASPGTSPEALVSVAGFYQVGSVAVIGSSLYWTTIYLGTTVFRPALQRADLGGLRQGAISTSTHVASSWLVRGHDGNLFIAENTDLWHVALARMPESLGPTTTLAVFDSAVGEIQFLDGWALTSVSDGGCGSIRYRLVAIRTDAAGGPTVQLAADLVTPAVLGRELAFVDAAGMLHLVSLDDLRAALTAVPASPQ